MSDHFQQIYQSRAEDYERLIIREDYQGNLLKTLQEIRPLEGLDVVEFGAGTGRLTRLLAPHVAHITAFDNAPAMLEVAKRVLADYSNVKLEIADNRNLPVSSKSADIAIEGWSFGHLCGWYPDTWRDEVHKSIQEMWRVLKDNGTAILLETMGTGHETPTPPTPTLAEFYTMLENELGFTALTIRTDYQFVSLDEAVEIVQFFFGDTLANEVREKNWQILPECTGIWFKHGQ
jgi:ubiquinone/menaquinone biosynthesis C-methylase UbiE